MSIFPYVTVIILREEYKLMSYEKNMRRNRLMCWVWSSKRAQRIIGTLFGFMICTISYLHYAVRTTKWTVSSDRHATHVSKIIITYNISFLNCIKKCPVRGTRWGNKILLDYNLIKYKVLSVLYIYFIPILYFSLRGCLAWKLDENM